MPVSRTMALQSQARLFDEASTASGSALLRMADRHLVGGTHVWNRSMLRTGLESVHRKAINALLPYFKKSGIKPSNIILLPHSGHEQLAPGAHVETSNHGNSTYIGIDTTRHDSPLGFERVCARETGRYLHMGLKGFVGFANSTPIERELVASLSGFVYFMETRHAMHHDIEDTLDAESFDAATLATLNKTGLDPGSALSMMLSTAMLFSKRPELVGEFKGCLV